MIRVVIYCIIGVAALIYAWSRNRRTVSAWVLFPVSFAAVHPGYFIATQLFRHQPVGTSATYDEYAYFVDGSFGTQPSVLVSHLVAQIPGFRSVLWFAYESLFMALLFTCAISITRKNYWRIVSAIMVTAFVGVLCYNLFPACGPAYLLGDSCFYGNGSGCGYLVGTSPRLIDMELRFARNAMPSLHMTWALLIWWSCRGRKRYEWFGLTFCVLTALATLTFGEHYLIDLCAAFPFALAIWSLCGDSIQGPRRLIVALSSASGYLMWVLAIRSFPEAFFISPVVPWVVSIASVSLPLVALFRSTNDLASHPLELARVASS